MTSIFELIFIVLLIYLLIKLTLFLTERLSLIFKIRSLRKITGVRVEFTAPASSLLPFLTPRTSRAAVAYIHVGGKIYDLYLFSGEGRLRHVHIANEKYVATFSKRGGTGIHIKNTVVGGRVLNSVTRFLVPHRAERAKTRFLPDAKAEAGHIPVLLFSPVPNELTYVTKERTSIKVAFTGDTVGKFMIFTKSTFYNRIDRASRGFFDQRRIKDE